jgi:hypothetical protein
VDAIVRYLAEVLFAADPLKVYAGLLDPLKVNAALLDLGCEVRLRWSTEEYTSCTYKHKDGSRRGGKRRTRFVFDRGRFRLGRRQGVFKAAGLGTDGLPLSCLSPPASSPRRGPWRRPGGPGSPGGERSGCSANGRTTAGGKRHSCGVGVWRP